MGLENQVITDIRSHLDNLFRQLLHLNTKVLSKTIPTLNKPSIIPEEVFDYLKSLSFQLAWPENQLGSSNQFSSPL